MKLIIRNVIIIGLTSAILAFFYTPYNTGTTQEKLQAITAQIDAELSVIDKSRNKSRILSEELIKEISNFSNLCPLEKVLVDGRETAQPYSVEKGKLLLTLLNRKLVPSNYEKIFEMVSFQNAFLKNANLKGINLSRIQLPSAYLVGAELNNANLESVNLSKANLSNANLNTANLKAANLQETILNGADISDAIFINAYLVDAKLGNRAKLDRADFTGANLTGVDFNNVHPSFVKP